LLAVTLLMKKSKSKQDELDPVSTGLPTEVVVAEDTQETESESDGDDVKRTNASTELLAEHVAASLSNDENTLEETILVTAKNNDSDSNPIGDMLGQAQFAMDCGKQFLESTNVAGASKAKAATDLLLEENQDTGKVQDDTDVENRTPVLTTVVAAGGEQEVSMKLTIEATGCQEEDREGIVIAKVRNMSIEVDTDISQENKAQEMEVTQEEATSSPMPMEIDPATDQGEVLFLSTKAAPPSWSSPDVVPSWTASDDSTLPKGQGSALCQLEFQDCLTLKATFPRMKPMPIAVVEFITRSTRDEHLSADDPVSYANMMVGDFSCALPVCDLRKLFPLMIW
jgi:hypothetical protein